MSGIWSYLVEGTLAMILLTLLITHPAAFNKVLTAGVHTATGGVQALWATKRADVSG